MDYVYYTIIAALIGTFLYLAMSSPHRWECDPACSLEPISKVRALVVAGVVAVIFFLIEVCS